MVAVRGLVRSLHSNFGFEPRNAMLVDTDLNMAGYSGDSSARHAKAHDRCHGDDSRRDVRGIGRSAAVGWTAANGSNVFTDKTTDLRPSNAAADACMYNISPEYFHAAGTALLAGRSFHLA